MKTGLVLEGGAMRGIYTAGVLDVFLKNHIRVDGVIGVSAGAIHGCSYVSGQYRRSIRYYMKYMKDWRFMSVRSLLKSGNLVDTDFCYHQIPEQLDVFDHEQFEKSGIPFYVVCTDVETGKAEYVQMKDMKEINYLQASASMPLVSRIVEAGGRKYLDGGVADSIPIRAFRSMGYERNIIVLTRPAGYRKKPAHMAVFRKVYKKYPDFLKTMETRYIRYNRTMDLIERLEKKGEVLVIRPSRDPAIGRMEKNPAKVKAVYRMGCADAQAALEEVKRFVRKSEEEKNGRQQGGSPDIHKNGL